MVTTGSGPARGGARSYYHPIVRRYFPTADDQEVELRSSLMVMRDGSLSRLRSCSRISRPFWECLEQLASDYAFAAVPLPQLSSVRLAIIRVAAAASSLEFVDQSSACAGG